MKPFPWPMGEKDMEMLHKLAKTSPKKLFREYYPDSGNPEDAFNNWIQRIKIRIVRYQWYINNINNLTRYDKYLKKRLILPERVEVEKLGDFKE